MGNLFKKEIKCDECLKINIEPKFFTKKINIDSTLITYYDEEIKYDKYGDVIKNDKISPKQKNQYVEYKCSNNHKFVYKE